MLGFAVLFINPALKAMCVSDYSSTCTYKTTCKQRLCINSGMNSSVTVNLGGVCFHLWQIIIVNLSLNPRSTITLELF